MNILGFLSEVVLPTIVGATAAVVALVFLSKKIINHQLSKGIEEHKAQLTEKTEALKHKLSIYAHERNIRATRVDGQMATAIKDVYRSIAVLLKYAEKFANESPNPVTSYEEIDGHDTQKACEFRFYKEHAEYIQNSAIKLGSVLLDNAIFIDSETFKKIESVQSSFLSLSHGYLDPIIEEQCGQGDFDEIVDDLLKNRKKLAAYYNQELISLKEQIISTFRAQLGADKI